MAHPRGSRAPLEFGGPLGAAALMVLLPATMFHLLLVARSGPARLLGPPPYLPGPDVLWSPRVLLLWLTWLGLQAALYLLPARKVAEGLELKDKSRLRYPINGFQALVLTALLVGLAVSAGLPLGALPEMLVPLAFAATLTAFIFSFLLYLKALGVPPSALAPGGTSGNPIYDFFLGRELNPRICSFDFKYFCELRPGLIGWVLINLALLMQEAELRGSPSLAMWLVNGFQLLYVGDALWHEEAVLTTMDITHDGFGFMLAFGDLAWVPFTYSLQAQFLLHHPQPLGLPVASAICLINALGYYIFRRANSQKNTFRKNPSDPRVAGELGSRAAMSEVSRTAGLPAVPPAPSCPVSPQASRPSPRPRGGSCWCPGGGVWSATPTTSGTSSWLWRGPCPAGCLTCCPISTSSTSRRSWCTGKPGMNSSAYRSTAWPGRSTAGACLTESCPTSTEAAPPTPGGGTCPPARQRTQHQEPGPLPCSELPQAGVNSLREVLRREEK
uniref:Delta(14)-sterol reductase TM7SF2 n=1 Tax=Lynx canadensis TaxID=61383 RepID=A0A667GZT7_LYNCA